jgi:hypothetical protein
LPTYFWDKMLNRQPSVSNSFHFLWSNTITSPTCFNHKITILRGRPNIEGNFTICVHKRLKHLSHSCIVITFINS